MKKRIRIKKGSIALYELEVMSRGVCRSIAPLHFAEEEDDFLVEPEIYGLDSIDRWLMAERSFVFDGYRRLLRLLGGLAQSLIDASDYLIPAEHLSLEPCELFIKDDTLLTIPSGNTETSFEEKIQRLLSYLGNRYPQTHASYIRERLPEYFDAKILLRQVTCLELDLSCR